MRHRAVSEIPVPCYDDIVVRQRNQREIGKLDRRAEAGGRGKGEIGHRLGDDAHHMLDRFGTAVGIG